jgi:hypothetical protein
VLFARWRLCGVRAGFRSLSAWTRTCRGCWHRLVILMATLRVRRRRSGWPDRGVTGAAPHSALPEESARNRIKNRKLSEPKASFFGSRFRADSSGNHEVAASLRRRASHAPVRPARPPTTCACAYSMRRPYWQRLSNDCINCDCNQCRRRGSTSARISSGAKRVTSFDSSSSTCFCVSLPRFCRSMPRIFGDAIRHRLS